MADGEANLVWLAMGQRTSTLAANAVRRGLVLRPFADEGIRITIGEPAANDRVLEVTATWH